MTFDHVVLTEADSISRPSEGLITVILVVVLEFVRMGTAVSLIILVSFTGKTSRVFGPTSAPLREMIFVQVVQVEAVSMSHAGLDLIPFILPVIVKFERVSADESPVDLCKFLTRALEILMVLDSASGSLVWKEERVSSPPKGVSVSGVASSVPELLPLLRLLLMLPINRFMPPIAFWLPFRSNSTPESMLLEVSTMVADSLAVSPGKAHDESVAGSG
jgi:hypothetical protein